MVQYMRKRGGKSWKKMTFNGEKIRFFSSTSFFLFLNGKKAEEKKKERKRREEMLQHPHHFFAFSSFRHGNIPIE